MGSVGTVGWRSGGGWCHLHRPGRLSGSNCNEQNAKQQFIGMQQHTL